jgi:hypothetical protein
MTYKTQNQWSVQRPDFCVNGKHCLEIGPVLKNAVHWEVTPRGSCKNRRFGETYRLHYQREKNQLAMTVYSKQHLKHAAKNHELRDLYNPGDEVDMFLGS